MKQMIIGALSLLILAVGCSKEENIDEMFPALDLVTPNVTALVDDSFSQSPLTGIIEAYPCNSGGSIYFGNYVNGKLTPFYGFYKVLDGHTYGEYNRVLNLPVGDYNMVYWGTPKYEEPIYTTPAIREPGFSVGVDLSKLYFRLRENADNKTYRPVYDMVHAVVETHTEADFKASLRRAVAGLKVIVRKKDNGIIGTNIQSVRVQIGSISEKLNVYSAEPENPTKTVAFGLARSTDGTSMSNATVMLFPSGESPLLELILTMEDGSEQILSKNLNTKLTANTRLTLNIVIGDSMAGGSVGNFSIENWTEASETIEFTMEN